MQSVLSAHWTDMCEIREEFKWHTSFRDQYIIVSHFTIHSGVQLLNQVVLSSVVSYHHLKLQIIASWQSSETIWKFYLQKCLFFVVDENNSFILTLFSSLNCSIILDCFSIVIDCSFIVKDCSAMAFVFSHNFAACWWTKAARS